MAFNELKNIIGKERAVGETSKGKFDNLQKAYRKENLKSAKENNIKSYRFKGFKVPQENDYLKSRKTVLTNSDCNIILAAPKASLTEYFYKNTDAVCCIKRLKFFILHLKISV